MSLHRLTWGQGADLVLLHGWGMNAAVWSPLQALLGARFRVCAIELPGHGASAPADGPDPDQWAAQCLDAAPRRATWLGWSLGGQLAIRAALMAPERVSGLVLQATTPRFVQGDGWRNAMPEAVFAQFAADLEVSPQATLGRFLALQVRGADAPRDTLKRLRAELLLRPSPSSEGLHQGLALLRATDLCASLPLLRCASHWVLGARDTLVPADLHADLHRLLPAARVTLVAGAGHAPFLSHPQASLAALLGEPSGVTP